MMPSAGAAPVDGGERPFFALFAAPRPQVDALLGRFEGLLDPQVRPPIRAGGVWLVRPDGYVAMEADGWREVAAYLDRLRAVPASDEGRRS